MVPLDKKKRNMLCNMSERSFICEGDKSKNDQFPILDRRNQSSIPYWTIMQDLIRTKDIPTQVKDPDLVQRRRRQIADAAVQLFIDKGFHKTTTRQIARASGI